MMQVQVIHSLFSETNVACLMSNVLGKLHNMRKTGQIQLQLEEFILMIMRCKPRN